MLNERKTIIKKFVSNNLQKITIFFFIKRKKINNKILLITEINFKVIANVIRIIEIFK